MVERVVVVRNKDGIHARPSAGLSTAATNFKSAITLTKEDLQVNAKSLMGVMTLAAGLGEEVLVTAEGADEQMALEKMVEMLEFEYNLSPPDAQGMYPFDAVYYELMAGRVDSSIPESVAHASESESLPPESQAPPPESAGHHRSGARLPLRAIGFAVVPLLIALAVPATWLGITVKSLCGLALLSALGASYRLGLLGGVFFSCLSVGLLWYSPSRLFSYVGSFLLVISVFGTLRTWNWLEDQQGENETPKG